MLKLPAEADPQTALNWLIRAVRIFTGNIELADDLTLIVGRFADVYIDQFDEPTLDDFERLIELANADLYAWIVGHEAVPAKHDTLVLRQLIAFHNRAEAKPASKPGPAS